MPTYEYVCESCGNQYEKRESFDAKPRQKCPACGRTAQRVLSAPAVVFKGSGFYKTDSRGASSATADSAPPTPSTPAVPSTDAGAPDTAPATTTESAAAS